MAIKFANLASTTLASGITSSATSLTVASASGFPTLGASDYCYVTIGEGVTSEIVKVTAISGTTFTIVRAQDGTTASAFSSGEVVALRVVAAALDDIASAADTESVSIDGDTMTGALTLDTGTNGVPTINLSHSNSGADNFRIQGGIPGTSNGGFSIRDVDAGVNRFTIDSSGNATFSGTISSGAITSSGSVTASDGIFTDGAAGSASVFNEDGTTADFRVESSGSTSMLFVDGGLNRVGLGTAGPQQRLDVRGGGLQIDGYITTPASGQTGVLIDYYSGASRFWSRGTASARGSFSFIQLENDGENQQTALGIDASGNATFAGTISSGAITATGTSTVNNLNLGTGSNTGVISLKTYDDAANEWSMYTWTDDTFRLNYNGSGGDEFILNSSGNATFAGTITTTGSSITVDPASGDAVLVLAGTAGAQTLRIDQNSIRTTTNSGISILTNSANALTIDTSQNITVAGDLTLESGTSGTTDKIILKTSDNADLNKFIRTNAYYVEFGGHANEGFKFVDTNSNTLLALYGGNNALAKQAVFAGALKTANTITNDSPAHAYLSLDSGGSFESGLVLKRNGSNIWEGPYISGSSDNNLKFYSYGDSALQMTIRDGVNGNGGTVLGGLGVSDGSAHYGHYGALLLNTSSSYTSGSRGWMMTNAYKANRLAFLYSGSATTLPALTTYGNEASGTYVALDIQNNGVATFHNQLHLKIASSANLNITSGGGQNYTQGDIRISSSTVNDPSARGQGIYYFNEGQDATWYSGTLYNQGSYWGIGRATGTTLNAAAADVANYKLSLDTSGNMALTGGVTAGGTFVTSTAALLRRVENSWTVSPTHDVLYNGWTSATGDYVYLKVPGNTTDSHGQAFFGDNVFAYGITTMETGAVASNISATAPIDSTWFYANSSGLTVNGDVTANNYNGHKLSNSEWGMTLGTYMTADITGQKISKSGSTGWNGEVRSTLGLQRSAEARLIPNQNNKHLMFGLNTDPTTSTSFASIDYAFYLQGNGNLSAYENGVSVSLGITYAAGDDLRVVLEKPYIRYIKNDAVVRTVKAGSSPFANGDETFYFDSSFYDQGSDITRLIHFGPTRALGLEGRPLEKFNSTGRYFLGNNDWSDIPTGVNSANFFYNTASKGMHASGTSVQLFIPCRIPIDPEASYRIRVRMMKLSGTGAFYVGTETVTEDFVNLSTDPFTSYNYGVASNATPSVGAETTYEAVYSGYNTTSGGSATAFDPEGKYFNLFILCNYQGSGITVIRSVEVERYDPKPLVYGLRKINSDPIVINSNQAASHALRVYYDMSVYNTINFTDSAWTMQGKIAGVSNGLQIFGDSHKFYTRTGGAMYHYSSQSSHYLHSGTGSNDWEIGRDGSQKLRIYVDDHHVNLLAYQDDDSNAEHNFVLDRYFDGTGGNNFVVRKNGSNQMYIDTDGIINYYTFRAFDADATPAGTVFANTIKGKDNHRTIYFDGHNTTVSTWYGVGNNPFSAIDSTDGVMDFWINNSSGVWRNPAHVDENGLHVTYGQLYTGSINSGSRISVLNGANAQGIAVRSLYVGTSYSNTASDGMVNTLNGYQVGNETFIDSGKNISGFTKNYADSSGWELGATGTFSSRVGYYGGDFAINGTSSENSVVSRKLPDGSYGKVWHTPSNDSASDADGGWTKNITGLDPEGTYLSVVYVIRNNANTSGTFYHGCHPSNTLHLNGNANTNPYFGHIGISSLPVDVWCVSIGIIRGHSGSVNSNVGTPSGLYRCDTGQKIANWSDFRMKSGSTGQSHRTYLYYSSSTPATLSWAKPGFYLMDGTEPSLPSLIRPMANQPLIRLMDNGSNGAIMENQSGNLEFGPLNTDYCHFQTDRARFYFSRKIIVDEGVVSSYNEDLVLQRAQSSSYQMTLNTSGATFTGSVTQNSDERLKKDILPIKGSLALDTVMNLKGVTYTHKVTNNKHIGFVAQQIEADCPSISDRVVVEGDDQEKIKSVRYSDLVALLTEALKEQQSQIAALTKRIEELETHGDD